MDRTWVFVGLFGIVFSILPVRNNCRTSVESPVVLSIRLKELNTPLFRPVKLDIFDLTMRGITRDLFFKFVFVLHGIAAVRVKIIEGVRVTSIPINYTDVHSRFVGCDLQCVSFDVPEPSSEVLTGGHHYTTVSIDQRKPFGQGV